MKKKLSILAALLILAVLYCSSQSFALAGRTSGSTGLTTEQVRQIVTDTINQLVPQIVEQTMINNGWDRSDAEVIALVDQRLTGLGLIQGGDVVNPALIPIILDPIATQPGGGTGGGIPEGALNVMDYGAVGNGTTNDTTAIQNAVNAAYNASGGTVYFPPGTYKVLATEYNGAINLKSNVNLYLDENTTIKQAYDGTYEAAVIWCPTISNCTIEGASKTTSKILGNLDTYDGSDVQGYTHCINLMACTDITIKNLYIGNCHGDGIITQYSWPADNTDYCDNILIEDCFFTECWRNGVTLDSQKNLTLRNSEFCYNGPYGSLYSSFDYPQPWSGLEFEPDNNNCWVGVNILIQNIECHHNATFGLFCTAYNDYPPQNLCTITFDGVYCHDNNLSQRSDAEEFAIECLYLSSRPEGSSCTITNQITAPVYFGDYR